MPARLHKEITTEEDARGVWIHAPPLTVSYKAGRGTPAKKCLPRPTIHFVLQALLSVVLVRGVLRWLARIRFPPSL
jgi:hypothetical protein